MQQQNESPGVLANASCWALHMGVGSNARHQLFNGVDMVLQPIVPRGRSGLWPPWRGAQTTWSVGGISFVTIAKVFVVQKGADSEEPECCKKTTGK